MEWTDISITVKKADADTAEAIATMIANGGIYIEDYSDLEEQVQAIAHIDLIEQELLEKDRDTVIVHMYLSPEEHPAEILALFQEKLEASGIAYTLSTSGVEQEDWQNGWKKYYHSMEIGRHLAVVPSWETYENTDGRAVLKQVSDCGYRRADALVVRYFAGLFVLRHVEVAAQQNLLSFYVDIPDGFLLIIHKQTPQI